MVRVYQIVLVLTFSVLLCIPGVSMLVHPDPPKLYGVKPVPYPPFEPRVSYVSEFEEYFTANFGYKRRLIQLHNELGYHVLHDLQSENVLVGRDGWLFLKQNYGWESFRSEEPLRPSEAAAWVRSLEGAQRWLAKRHVAFLFVIVPSKETIYPEHLPKSAVRARSTSRLDEVLAALAESKVQYLELRAPLLEARKHDPRLWDKLDSHWNGRGAQIGAKLVMQRVAELLERPPSYAELDSKLVPHPSWADMSLILSVEERLTEPSVALVPNRKRARRLEPPERILNPTRRQQNRMVYEVPDETLPRALILRDSFVEGFMESFAEKFQRSVWIWTHSVDLGLVDREKPDIVIMEMTERFLIARPPRLLTRPRKR